MQKKLPKWIRNRVKEAVSRKVNIYQAKVEEVGAPLLGSHPSRNKQAAVGVGYRQLAKNPSSCTYMMLGGCTPKMDIFSRGQMITKTCKY
jgi:hypothetical protein